MELKVAYAAQITDLFVRAYFNFSTDDQLSFAVDHFISGIADAVSREYSTRELACRPLNWQDAVRIEQVSKAVRLSEPLHLNATATLVRASSNSAGAISSFIAFNTISRGSARHRPDKNALSPRTSQPRTDLDSEKQSRFLFKQEYLSARYQASLSYRSPYEKTTDAMVMRKPEHNLNRD